MSTDTPTYVPPVIALTPCESSQITAFGYDAATQTLAVQFPGRGATPGSTYHYSGVPSEVFTAMQAAESKGKFFGTVIRGRFEYEKQPDPVTGIAFGLKTAQEPKYTVSQKDGRLVNRDTGKPIPDDEPVFILRAQDIHAVPLLYAYLAMVTTEHSYAVHRRIKDFEAFALAHLDRMKEPDSASLSV